MVGAKLKLVTRGDDSGVCHSANTAIRDACTEGILRNTSIVVPGPAFEEAAEMYRGIDGLCVGLHATLTAEWDAVRWGPVLGPDNVPSLVDEDGHFPPTTRELNEMGAEPDEMMREIEAQLQLARSRDIEVAYVDTHMGFGWVQDVGKKIRQFATEQGLLTWDRVERLPRSEGDFDDRVAAFLATLEAAPPGTYLTVGHPVYPDDDVVSLVKDSSRGQEIAQQRDGQRRAFMDPKVLDFCAVNGVEAVRFTDIASA